MLWASWCRVTFPPGTLMKICPPNTGVPFTYSRNPGTGVGVGVGRGVAVGTGVGVFVGVGVGAGVGVDVGSAHVATRDLSLSIATVNGLDLASEAGISPAQATNTVLHEAETITVVPLA